MQTTHVKEQTIAKLVMGKVQDSLMVVENEIPQLGIFVISCILTEGLFYLI